MTSGSHLRACVLGCCAAVLVAGSTAPAVAAPDAVALPPALVAAVQRDLGMDVHEYLTRVDTAERLSVFADAARRTHPSVFAGVRMDGARAIVLLADGPDAANARTAAEQAGFTVQTVASSESTLNERMIGLEQWIGKQPASIGDAVVGYGIDVLHNDIALRATRDVRIPPGLGSIRSVVTAAPEAVPQDDSAVHPAAGAADTGDRIGGDPYAIDVAGQGHRCSFGFNGTDAQGNTIDITAGHCDPDNLVGSPAKTAQQQPVYDFQRGRIGPRLGYFEATSFGPHDYSIIRIDDAVDARFRNDLVSAQRSSSQAGTGSANVVAAPANTLHIDGTAEPVVGEAVCKSGSTSGYSCGTVLAVGQQGRLNNVPGHGDRTVTIQDMFYSSICAQRGDSGGPIFAGTKALGINSAIITARTPADQGCGHAPVLLGQPIGTVTADHPGVRIFTE